MVEKLVTRVEGFFDILNMRDDDPWRAWWGLPGSAS